MDGPTDPRDQHPVALSVTGRDPISTYITELLVSEKYTHTETLKTSQRTLRM